MRGDEVNEADPATLACGPGGHGAAAGRGTGHRHGWPRHGWPRHGWHRSGQHGHAAPAAGAGTLSRTATPGPGYCTRDWNAATTIPGWSIRTGSPNVMCYSTGRISHPAGPAGTGFFSSGPYGDSAMTQTAWLGRRAPGSLSYRLSGWLGGWKTEPGYVQVSLTFLGRAGRRRRRRHAAHGDPVRAGQPERVPAPGDDRPGAPGHGRHPGRGALPAQFHPGRRRARAVRPRRRPARQPLAHRVRAAARRPPGGAAVVGAALRPRVHDHDGEHQRQRGAVRPQSHAVLPPADGPGRHAGQLSRGLPPQRRELPGHRGRGHLRQGRHLLAGYQGPAPEPR